MITEERFRALIGSWGADPRRWPLEERVEAQAFASAHPDEARALLAEAQELDDLLLTSSAAYPSNALRARVIASAAEAGLGRRERRWEWLDRLYLTLGAGWAAAACAGVAAGVLLTGQGIWAAEADAVLFQASLVALDDTEVLG